MFLAGSLKTQPRPPGVVPDTLIYILHLSPVGHTSSSGTFRLQPAFPCHTLQKPLSYASPQTIPPSTQLLWLKGAPGTLTVLAEVIHEYDFLDELGRGTVQDAERWVKRDHWHRWTSDNLDRDARRALPPGSPSVMPLIGLWKDPMVPPQTIMWLPDTPHQSMS